MAARADVVVARDIPQAVTEFEGAHELFLLGVGVGIEVLADVRERLVHRHGRHLLGGVLVDYAGGEEPAPVEVILPARLYEEAAARAEGDDAALHALRELGRRGGDIGAAAVVAYPALGEEQHAVPAAQPAHYVHDAAGLARALGDLDGVEPAVEVLPEEAHGRDVLARHEVHMVPYVLRHDEEIHVRGVVREYEHALAELARGLHPHAVGHAADGVEDGPEERVYALIVCVRPPLGRAHSVHTSSGLSA